MRTCSPFWSRRAKSGAGFGVMSAGPRNGEVEPDAASADEDPEPPQAETVAKRASARSKRPAAQRVGRRRIDSHGATTVLPDRALRGIVRRIRAFRAAA